jgi:hypothetical protein
MELLLVRQRFCISLEASIRAVRNDRLSKLSGFSNPLEGIDSTSHVSQGMAC